MTHPAGLPVRTASWQVLADLRRQVPWETALRNASEALDGPDRRLVYEIAAGVCRHRGTLDDTLRPLLSRPWSQVDPATRNILRVGAYQLLYLDRVPSHAAVDTAVTLTRHVGSPKAAGLVNAVLRRLAAHPDQFRQPERTHPTWIVDRWRTRFGSKATDQLIEWNDSPPPVVVQPARWSRPILEKAWTEAKVDYHLAPFECGLIPSLRDPRSLPGFEEGGFVVQDPAQALVARFAGIPERAMVYDACAAPGGKTIALAGIAARVVSGDRSRDRLSRLKETVRRAGTGSERLILADAMSPPLREMDAVLLDVPCLGTGTFARHPDARWRVSPRALKRLADTGKQLLRAAAPIVKPGGWLCYSTCSLESEENEEQVDAFLEDHPHFRRDPVPDVVPQTAMTPMGDLRLSPHAHGTDGAYAARLHRIP